MQFFQKFQFPAGQALAKCVATILKAGCYTLTTTKTPLMFGFIRQAWVKGHTLWDLIRTSDPLICPHCPTITRTKWPLKCAVDGPAIANFITGVDLRQVASIIDHQWQVT